MIARDVFAFQRFVNVSGLLPAFQPLLTSLDPAPRLWLCSRQRVFQRDSRNVSEQPVIATPHRLNLAIHRSAFIAAIDQHLAAARSRVMPRISSLGYDRLLMPKRVSPPGSRGSFT